MTPFEGYQPTPSVESQTPTGFTELSRGDLNSDGLPDLVAYVPSELVLASGEVVAKELGIFVADGNGTEAQASLLNGAIYAGGYLIYAFGDGSGSPLPAAYTVVLGDGSLILTPLASNGAVAGRSVLLVWNPATDAYAAMPGESLPRLQRPRRCGPGCLALALELVYHDDCNVRAPRRMRRGSSQQPGRHAYRHRAEGKQNAEPMGGSRAASCYGCAGQTWRSGTGTGRRGQSRVAVGNSARP